MENNNISATYHYSVLHRRDDVRIGIRIGDGTRILHRLPLKIENVTAQLRGYINEHPERTTDSMMNHVLDDINNGKIASVKTLASLRKKKLSTEDLYDLCRKSTLVFGKMEHVGYLGKDSAYSNASAVALTPDGICATNFHVISDIVICGAFDYKNRWTAPGS